MTRLKRVKIGGAKNVRSFFFFLLITTVMAALIKLSKTYESTYLVNVKITEIPLDKIVQSISPKNIEVKVENSGFSILRSNWKTPEAHISFKSLQKELTEGTYQYNLLDNMSNVEHTLSDNLNIIAVLNSKVVVAVDEMATKEIEIRPDLKLSYAPGYHAKGKLSIEPKTIKVVGPNSILDKLEVLKTEFLVKEDIKDDIEVTVNIATIDSLQEIKFEATDIVLSQEVTRFTEGTVTVPVTVLNRDNKEVKILPKDVEVVYSVDLSDFETIKGKDFIVTCDLSNASEKDNHLLLTIKEQPKEVSQARLVDKQVQFIVIN